MGSFHGTESAETSMHLEERHKLHNNGMQRTGWRRPLMPSVRRTTTNNGAECHE
jgi:hypothetical protein